MMHVTNVLARLNVAASGYIVVRNDITKIDQLQQQLLDNQEEKNNLLATIDAEERNPTDEELKQINDLVAEFENLQEQIDQRTRIANQAAKLAESVGRKVPGDDQPGRKPETKDTVPAQPLSASRGRWGWNRFGEFAKAVVEGSKKGGNTDPRLVANAPSSVATEGVGGDGGFAVPPDFNQEIVEKIFAEDQLVTRTDQLQSGSNTWTGPLDETTDWQTSGGVQAFWEGEAQQLTPSKPQIAPLGLRLHKLTALVNISEELLSDAPGLDSYLRRKAPRKMQFKVTDAIISGTGAGMPMGILNSPSLVTVPKEASQAADTIVIENLVNMWSRLYGPSQLNAVWLINQDILPQLMLMSFAVKNVAGSENVGGVPVWMPANQISGSPFSMLMGRPVIPTQACKTLGDKGDIILANMEEYLTITKTTGIRTDVSMHLWFDWDVMAFRFIMRIAGQPWFSKPIDPLNGANTLSPFVTLEERA